MGVTVSGHGGEGVVGVRREQSLSTHLRLVVTFNYLTPPHPSFTLTFLSYLLPFLLSSFPLSETGFHCVAHAGLELMIPPASASQMLHLWTWGRLLILFDSFFGECGRRIPSLPSRTDFPVWVSVMSKVYPCKPDLTTGHF